MNYWGIKSVVLGIVIIDDLPIFEDMNEMYNFYHASIRVYCMCFFLMKIFFGTLS